MPNFHNSLLYMYTEAKKLLAAHTVQCATLISRELIFVVFEDQELSTKIIHNYNGM